MATSIANLANNVLIIDSIQAALKNALIPIKAVSSALSLTGKIVDDVIRVPVITAATTAAKTPGTASTSAGGVSAVSVTLDTYQESSWQLNVGSVSAADAPKTFAGMAVEATYALAKKMLDDLFALVTAANFATPRVIAPGDFGMNDLGLLWQDAEDKKLSLDRSIVLNAAMTGALIGNSNLGLILATLGDKSLMTAQLPNLLTMKGYNYSPLATAGNLTGFVCDKSALAIAMAPPDELVNPGEGGLRSAEVITDTDSSVVMRYLVMTEPDAGYVKGRVECIYGVKKIQDALIRIISA